MIQLVADARVRRGRMGTTLRMLAEISSIISKDPECLAFEITTSPGGRPPVTDSDMVSVVLRWADEVSFERRRKEREVAAYAARLLENLAVVSVYQERRADVCGVAADRRGMAAVT